ncbi:hypothetical protein [Stackebrandtia nassauensis]|uniref:Uncharacterized protein n=1 Tax=Stackebrandtia nassauensis (strain DSM 44728 / CIP 108903 / NRRL B-16338 / NBRC 102104 / LLR-40K-21) TaxID=446470 RepID=D3PUX0_STANL|nr:hypothetical protein [Stackebrandtia nassauensis]ADD44994.1 hypothetical protein Snas_5361 [Stackebrandtia nassauensis DSM 44728]
MNAYLAELTAIGGRIEALAKQKMIEEIEAMPAPAGPDGRPNMLGHWIGQQVMKSQLPDLKWVTSTLVEYGMVHGKALDGQDAVADLEAARKALADFKSPIGFSEGVIRSIQKTLSSWEEGAGKDFESFYLYQLPYHSRVQQDIMEATHSAFDSYAELYRHVREIGLEVARKTEETLAKLDPRAVVAGAFAKGFLEVLGISLEVAGIFAPKGVDKGVALSKVVVTQAGKAVAGIQLGGDRVAGILESMSAGLKSAGEHANQVHQDLDKVFGKSHEAAEIVFDDAIPSYPPFTGR